MTPTNPTDAQMKLARKCAEIVIITREDRDATAEYLGYPKEHFEPDGNMELDLIRAFARHRQAAEARAQGLVDALEMMDGIEYKELNLSNYTHDDVCALNNAYVEMQLILTQALATWRRT